MTALETTLERKLKKRLPAPKLTRLQVHLLIILNPVDLMTECYPVDAILGPHGPAGVRQAHGHSTSCPWLNRGAISTQVGAEYETAPNCGLKPTIRIARREACTKPHPRRQREECSAILIRPPILAIGYDCTHVGASKRYPDSATINPSKSSTVQTRSVRPAAIAGVQCTPLRFLVRVACGRE